MGCLFSYTPDADERWRDLNKCTWENQYPRNVKILASVLFCHKLEHMRKVEHDMIEFGIEGIDMYLYLCASNLPVLIHAMTTRPGRSKHTNLAYLVIGALQKFRISVKLEPYEVLDGPCFKDQIPTHGLWRKSYNTVRNLNDCCPPNPYCDGFDLVDDTKISSEDDCGICLSNEHRRVHPTHKCGHYFCKQCIVRWAQQSRTPTCPACRQKMIPRTPSIYN